MRNQCQEYHWHVAYKLDLDHSAKLYYGTNIWMKIWVGLNLLLAS